jgi:aromatic ring-opening dioxygenase catalytic subunit (LigB family)
MENKERLPVYFIPHGGGPWPFMDNGTRFGVDPWKGLDAFLKGFSAALPRKPKAMVVVSGHWEQEPCFTVSTAAHPGMLYDYYGFPPETYELVYPAPGAPELAHQIRAMIETAGLEAAEDAERGFDHGVFIPLMVAFPEAEIPVVMLSLRQDLDPAAHVRLGQALEGLREQDILIVGSGMSYHNMRLFRSDEPTHVEASIRFDDWLTETIALEAAEREHALAHWSDNPDARACHVPDVDHLVPLFVVAGAAGMDKGVRIFNDRILGKPYSGYRFG